MVQRFHLLTTALINSLGDRHPDSWITLLITAVSKPSYSLETALSGLWDLTSSESWGRCWELMLVHWESSEHSASSSAALGTRAQNRWVQSAFVTRDINNAHESRPLLCCAAPFTRQRSFPPISPQLVLCAALMVFQRKTSSKELKGKLQMDSRET